MAGEQLGRLTVMADWRSVRVSEWGKFFSSVNIHPLHPLNPVHCWLPNLLLLERDNWE
ncbi:hypothetical protein QUA71_18825 [Microcoleus sp. MON1_C5]|uniref:hypothetical protein n=1 Tax=Microcoleus sp. MON1_C5 TaxID=2818828 RepID=UPI002FD67278